MPTAHLRNNWSRRFTLSRFTTVSSTFFYTTKARVEGTYSLSCVRACRRYISLKKINLLARNFVRIESRSKTLIRSYLMMCPIPYVIDHFLTRFWHAFKHAVFPRMIGGSALFTTFERDALKSSTWKYIIYFFKKYRLKLISSLVMFEKKSIRIL